MRKLLLAIPFFFLLCLVNPKSAHAQASLIQKCHNGAASGASISCTLGSNVTSGNNIICIGFSYGGTTGGCSDNHSFTWNNLGNTNPAIAGDPTARGVYIQCAPITSTVSDTVTFSNASNGNQVIAAEFSGITCTRDQAAILTNGNPNTTISTSNLTTVYNNDMVISALYLNTSNTTTVSSGFTIDDSVNSWLANQPLYLTTNKNAAAATYNATYTSSGGQFWVSVFLAIQLAPAPSPSQEIRVTQDSAHRVPFLLWRRRNRRGT